MRYFDNRHTELILKVNAPVLPKDIVQYFIAQNIFLEIILNYYHTQLQLNICETDWDGAICV